MQGGTTRSRAQITADLAVIEVSIENYEAFCSKEVFLLLTLGIVGDKWKPATSRAL